MGYFVLLISLFSTNACALGRKAPEPKIERCSHFSDGSAVCLQADGQTFLTRLPSELENYISTNPQDAEKIDQWCHRRRNRSE